MPPSAVFAAGTAGYRPTRASFRICGRIELLGSALHDRHQVSGELGEHGGCKRRPALRQWDRHNRSRHEVSPLSRPRIHS